MQLADRFGQPSLASISRDSHGASDASESRLLLMRHGRSAVPWDSSLEYDPEDVADYGAKDRAPCTAREQTSVTCHPRFSVTCPLPRRARVAELRATPQDLRALRLAADVRDGSVAAVAQGNMLVLPSDWWTSLAVLRIS